MKSIYEYSDYRLFLKDLIAFKQEKNPLFSLRSLTQKADIKSSSFFSHIISGKRNLSKTSLLKTCRGLGLTKQEAAYFENLVFFNQAKSVDEKNHFFEVLTELRNTSSITSLQDEQYDYFSEWYHSVIRELVCYLTCGNDYEKIASYLIPEVTPTQVKESIDLLLRLNLLQFDKGKYTQSEPLIQSEMDTEFKRFKVLKFQRDMMRRVSESFTNVPDYKRMTSASTFSISSKNFQRAQEILRETRMKLLRIAEQDKHPEDTFLLNMNLIALTKSFFRKGKRK